MILPPRAVQAPPQLAGSTLLPIYIIPDQARSVPSLTPCQPSLGPPPDVYWGMAIACVLNALF